MRLKSYFCLMSFSGHPVDTRKEVLIEIWHIEVEFDLNHSEMYVLSLWGTEFWSIEKTMLHRNFILLKLKFYLILLKFGLFIRTKLVYFNQ